MKIGIDARLWSETGVGRYIRNLVENLKLIDKKNKYYIFVRSSDIKEVLEKLNDENFEIVPTDIRWHSISEQIKYPKLLKKYDLDLMHFAYFSLPLFYNRPFVVTVHDLIINHYPTGKASTLPSPIYHLKRLAYLYLTKTAAKKAKKVITVSKATKDEIVDHLHINSEKIKITYLGVDKKLTQENSKNIIGSPYLLYVGNAYPHKNLKNLLKAFSLAKESNQKLVLVGKENFFYNELKKEVESNKLSGVVFFGEAKDEELSSLYSFANAFVMPSLMEGFGLPPLEAMANKCFVIASDIPSLREVCEDAALYFDPLNISDLKNKIEFAFSTKDKSQFVKKGLERVKSFSWEKMAKETLEVYESSNSIRQSK